MFKTPHKEVAGGVSFERGHQTVRSFGAVENQVTWCRYTQLRSQQFLYLFSDDLMPFVVELSSSLANKLDLGVHGETMTQEV